jgi:hypothetical protein
MRVAFVQYPGSKQIQKACKQTEGIANLDTYVPNWGSFTTKVSVHGWITSRNLLHSISWQDYGVDDRGLIPVRGRYYSLFSRIWAGFGAHQLSYRMNTRILFMGVKLEGALSWRFISIQGRHTLQGASQKWTSLCSYFKHKLTGYFSELWNRESCHNSRSCIFTAVRNRSQKSSVGIAMGRMTEGSGFDFRHRQQISLFSTASGPPLGRTRPHIEGVPQAEVKRQGSETNYSSLVHMLRVRGVIPPLSMCLHGVVLN